MTNEPLEQRPENTEILHESLIGMMSLPTTEESNFIEFDDAYGEDD